MCLSLRFELWSNLMSSLVPVCMDCDIQTGSEFPARYRDCAAQSVISRDGYKNTTTIKSNEVDCVCSRCSLCHKLQSVFWCNWLQMFKSKYLYFHLAFVDCETINISSKYQHIGGTDANFCDHGAIFHQVFWTSPEFGEFQRNSASIR